MTSDPHVLRQAGQTLTLLLAVLPCQLMESETEDELDCDSRCLKTIRNLIKKNLTTIGIDLVHGVLTTVGEVDSPLPDVESNTRYVLQVA